LITSLGREAFKIKDYIKVQRIPPECDSYAGDIFEELKAGGVETREDEEEGNGVQGHERIDNPPGTQSRSVRDGLRLGHNEIRTWHLKKG